MRCLGESRLYVYAAWRLLFLRKYSATLHILKDSKEDLCENSNLSLNEYYKTLKNEGENKEISNNNIANSNKEVWEEINSTFSYFVASNLSHISTSVRCHPLAVMDDGYTDLMYMSNCTGHGWCKLVSFLLNRHDEGKIFKSELECLENIDRSIGIDYRKVKAFRLIPKLNEKDSDLNALNYSIKGDLYDQAKKKGYLFKNFYSIDGERYDTQPIQVKVFKKGVRIFC